MKRLFAVVVVVGLAAACSDLFDTAVQCTTDRDCEKYGSVCDVANGVCASKGSSAGGDGSVPPPPPPGNDADLEDAPPPPPECNVANKTIADIVPGVVDGGDSEITTSTTLDCTKDWRLGGRIFVRSGATLTIQAGTTIRALANAGLVIQRGAKIIAQGQRNAPIIFTSAKAVPAPGDWRGVYVLGSAPPVGTVPGDAALTYGGTDGADASGTIAFVRIEYSTLGLVLGGTGNGTLVDYVDVRKTTDNGFTFYGGTVDAKHLVTQFPGDEAFEIDNGYAGRLQFLFSQQMRKGSGDHQGVLSDASNPLVYNATICNDSKADANYALVIRNGSKIDMSNAILTGFFGGIDVIGATTQTPLELRGSIAYDNGGNPAFAEDTDAAGGPQFVDDDNGFDEIAWFNDAARKNATTNPGLSACSDPTTPAPWPNAAITTNARTPPADGFFDTNAAYIGAFKDSTDTWMTGAWVRFSAQ